MTKHNRLGLTVLYTLSEYDAREIVQSRRNAGIATARGNDPREGQSYPALVVSDHYGPGVRMTVEGIQRLIGAEPDGIWGQETIDLLLKWQARNKDVYGNPLAVDGLWGSACNLRVTNVTVNLQVFLDGTDVYWATSRALFDPKVHGRWAREFSEDETPDLTDPDDWTPDKKGHFEFLF